MNQHDKTGAGSAGEAGRLYEIAYATHYQAQDLRKAFDLYRSLMAAHAGTPESAYSRAQLLNIANAVVPRQELLDAQVDLALAHLLRDDPPATGRLDAGSSPEAGLRDAEDHQAR